MEITKSKRRRISRIDVDGSTGEVVEERHTLSGKKLNYTMLHKPNLEIYKKLSGGAAKLLLILMDRYVEMNTNRVTCRKVDAEAAMDVSSPTLLGYWKELEKEGVLEKHGGWYYMNRDIATYGNVITKTK